MTDITIKKNNAKRLYFVLGVIAFVLGFFLFFQNQIDSKISNHPKIVTMEVKQENTDEMFREIKEELKELNRKMDELLRGVP